jgi:hypothetical protein
VGYISDSRTAIIAKAAGVSGIRGASVRMPDSIPASPWFVLAPHTATLTPGQRERTVFTIPLRLYIERQATDDQTIQTGDDLIDLTVQAFSQGITLATVTGTTELRLDGWDADNWITLGDAPGSPGSGVPYLLVEFHLRLNVTRSRNYTA